MATSPSAISISRCPRKGRAARGPPRRSWSSRVAQLAERLSELELVLRAELANLNTQLTDDTETLLNAQAEQVAALQAVVTLQQHQIADLRHALDTHTHDYYAPKGKPRRRVLEQTGPAEFPPD